MKTEKSFNYILIVVIQLQWQRKLRNIGEA